VAGSHILLNGNVPSGHLKDLDGALLLQGDLSQLLQLFAALVLRFNQSVVLALWYTKESGAMTMIS